MYHPPLWGIGVYKNIDGTRMREWDMNPQNCVLVGVNIDKGAEAGGPSAIGSQEMPLPSVIKLDLAFTELEPNVRSMEQNELMSRSRMKAGFGAR